MSRPLHKCLSSARSLLIEWRSVLRGSGPVTEDERLAFDAEIARFDDAIKSLMEARNELREQTKGGAK